MLPEGLDLEGAEDDQLDLFYLVDRVLDEIEVAKQAAEARKLADTTKETLEMPDVDPEYDTYDLMDHIENHDSYSDDSLNSSLSSSVDTKPTDMQPLSHQTGNPQDAYAYISPDELIGLESQDVVDLEQLYLQDCASTTQYQNSELRTENFTHQNDFQYVQPDFYNQNLPDVRTSNHVTNHNNVEGHTDLSFLEIPELNPRYPELNSRYPEVSKYIQDPAVSHISFHNEDSNDTYQEDFRGWTRKHPESWSTSDVLDWLFYCAEQIANEIGEDCSNLRAEAFSNVNGEVLCKMGPEDFRVREPKFGLSFYELFRKLLNDGGYFIQPSDIPVIEIPDSDTSYTESDYAPSHASSHASSHVSSHAHQQFSSVQTPDYSNLSHYFSNSVHSGQSSTNTSPDIHPAFLQYEYSAKKVPVSSQNSVENLINQNHPGLMRAYDSYSSTYNYHYYNQQLQTEIDVAAIRAKYETGVTPMRRRPGRPRTKNLQTEEELAAQRAKKLKSQHLWEFIFDLLNNPAYNPSVLKWESQSEGVFRFIQSETVAQLWGTLKSNENMTYEKLSRAMRHYYKRGIMERVEGRRLVYKFSRGTLEKMREKQGYQTDIKHELTRSHLTDCLGGL